ncbi:carbohydrate ABC transporter permease [Paenibacillus psychroresistens]|uniref:Carbohydrate ABC transporter permease n=2 Tax=Paenibacillus psychroresistens TaxID=1778678 RepID=A0A6B8RXE9_9BACL|nr:carbohydrate ABC transporter permease [Paenibacillus psychroresistens]
MLIPFILVISISLSDDKALIANGYQLLPQNFSLLAYTYIFESPILVLRAYGVTILMTMMGTILGLLLTAMTAYGISRRDYAYNRITTFLVFFTMLFNGGLVPTYILMTHYLHVKDTIWAMVLPGLLSPFNIMVMKGFLDKIPMEIVESAKVDGSREWRIFWQIIMPLSKPALATLGLFIAFNYWNSWFPALLYIDKESLVPLQLLLVRMMNSVDFLSNNADFVIGLGLDLKDLPKISARMAMAIVATGPMLLVFPFFQKYFVKGITVGSLKG